jgi:multidrug efflux pump subunit AcrA (membrane-fusion protein)
MMSVSASTKRMRARTKSVALAIAALTATIAIGHDADARSSRRESAIESVQTREPGEPILAVVSLRDQKITVYDAKGWILRAPVSSGQKGRETPAGIFAVIQKDAEHHSNLYDDAYMPNMQRITWSGIALHGGPLPGYPASHGCVRLPFDFAASLFEVTDLGLRVIVAPAEVAPTEISHPVLFPSKSADTTIVAARNAEADEATKKTYEARRAATAAFREQMQAMTAARVADFRKQKADAQLASADSALAAATSDEARQQAEDAKTKAAASVSDLETQLTAARADLQTKADAVAAARAAVEAAETARTAAAEAARAAARQLAPVSVLISRKTQMLYVRQSFEPIFESPVTISDPDRPIGTHIVTAMEKGGSEASLRWSAVTLEGTDDAKAALDRISIPQDVLDRIPGASPRSSLIVSDEPPSPETGKGTDFVVILSDQPQGGIKFRKRSTSPEMSYFGGFGRQRDFMTYWGPQFGRGFR